MQKNDNLYFIITTMDGVPLLDKNGQIVQFTSTHSMRLHASHNTYRSKKRHHTRALNKHQRYRAKKIFKENGYIPIGLLQ